MLAGSGTVTVIEPEYSDDRLEGWTDVIGWLYEAGYVVIADKVAKEFFGYGILEDM